MKRKSIPKPLRMKVWEKYIGDTLRGICFCCHREPITIANFECGHVLAVARGGENTLANLRPICSMCNKSMGAQHMDDYCATLRAYERASPEDCRDESLDSQVRANTVNDLCDEFGALSCQIDEGSRTTMAQCDIMAHRDKGKRKLTSSEEAAYAHATADISINTPRSLVDMVRYMTLEDYASTSRNAGDDEMANVESDSDTESASDVKSVSDAESAILPPNALQDCARISKYFNIPRAFIRAIDDIMCGASETPDEHQLEAMRQVIPLDVMHRNFAIWCEQMRMTHACLSQQAFAKEIAPHVEFDNEGNVIFTCGGLTMSLVKAYTAMRPMYTFSMATAYLEEIARARIAPRVVISREKLYALFVSWKAEQKLDSQIAQNIAREQFECDIRDVTVMDDDHYIFTHDRRHHVAQKKDRN